MRRAPRMSGRQPSGIVHGRSNYSRMGSLFRVRAGIADRTVPTSRQASKLAGCPVAIREPATDARCVGTACQRVIARQRSHQNAPPPTPARATPITAHHAAPATAPMSAITRHTVPTPAKSPRLCGHLGPRPSSTPRRSTPIRKKGAPIERIARTPNASRNPTLAHEANPRSRCWSLATSMKPTPLSSDPARRGLALDHGGCASAWGVSIGRISTHGVKAGSRSMEGVRE